MRIFYRQIEIMYRYNPMGRYFNLWFFKSGHCIYTATLFNRDWFIDAVSHVSESLMCMKLLYNESRNPDTNEIVMIGEIYHETK